MRGGGTRANHFFFFPLGFKSHFLFLADDGAGERRSEIGEDACVVPFRSQNQRPCTFTMSQTLVDDERPGIYFGGNQRNMPT